MKRKCVVYRRRGNLLIAASSHTKDGFWVTFPPYRQVDGSADPVEIGMVVADTLKLSKSGVPTPPRNDKSHIQGLLEAAGVSSYSTFAKGTVLVNVSVEEEWATLIPLMNKGARGGFEHPVPYTGPHARVDDPEELGRKVLEALDLAT